MGETDGASITCERNGDLLRARLAGEVDLSDIGDLERALESALAERPATVELDLSEVTFMDSTGVRWILQLQQSVTTADASLVIGPISEPVRRLFAIVGLLDHFGIDGE